MKRQLFMVATVGVLTLTACNDYNYTDDLQGLGQRVEVLEAQFKGVNEQLTALHSLLVLIEQNGYITNVVPNSDGTYTLRLSTGETLTLRSGRQGRDGVDGREAEQLIGVKQGSDGVWYWTLNGEWLLDGDGQRMRAGATDGRDGRDGTASADGKAIVPQMRINSETRRWEISTDGGLTWQDTGVIADGRDGRDGEDGKDGEDGTPDMFLDIIPSADGKYITFVMRNGQSFRVAIV